MGIGGQALQACHCENSACKHFPNICFKPIQVGSGARALYVGAICDECAKLMDKDYMFEPHGTVKKVKKWRIHLRSTEENIFEVEAKTLEEALKVIDGEDEYQDDPRHAKAWEEVQPVEGCGDTDEVVSAVELPEVKK